MIIKPKVRGFICTTAHPRGCQAQVKRQIDIAKQQGKSNGPKRVLVIGASTGYGLASRISAAFGWGADTIGVFFERNSSGDRTGTAGWYNTIAFHEAAVKEGLTSININGDAFSNEIKAKTIDAIRSHMGQVDLIVYSLASPKRTDPTTGEVYSSVIKPIGPTYHNKTVNVMNGVVNDVTIEPANESEIEQTVKVMGGEDWRLWIEALDAAGVLANGCKTVAYSYIGPAITHAVYREGTIGRAKDHLEATAQQLTQQLAKINGEGIISVNKALVTQASSAIPVVPLYISALFKVMKERNLHEGCIEQMVRLFTERLYQDGADRVDDKGRIRMDDWEMRSDVQGEVDKLWSIITTENVEQISDLAGYRRDFLQLFGFETAGIDYEEEIDLEAWDAKYVGI
jgi:enoyl-[acyl-carrier protein] reductase/trans-2-enoyl-CoA reductase (NAD+)